MTQNTSQLSAGTRAIAILALTAVLLRRIARCGGGVNRSAARQSGRHLDGAGDASRLHDQRAARSTVQLARDVSSAMERSSESAGSVAFAPGQRSPGHGAWTPKRGHTYKQEMIALVLFDTPPNLPGHRRSIRPSRFLPASSRAGKPSAIRFDSRLPIEIASAGTNWFYKANGELYRSGCSTATGQRF